jgi:hypothetical protein
MSLKLVVHYYHQVLKVVLFQAFFHLSWMKFNKKLDVGGRRVSVL